MVGRGGGGVGEINAGRVVTAKRHGDSGTHTAGRCSGGGHSGRVSCHTAQYTRLKNRLPRLLFGRENFSIGERDLGCPTLGLTCKCEAAGF